MFLLCSPTLRIIIFYDYYSFLKFQGTENGSWFNLSFFSFHTNQIEFFSCMCWLFEFLILWIPSSCPLPILCYDVNFGVITRCRAQGILICQNNITYWLYNFMLKGRIGSTLGLGLGKYDTTAVKSNKVYTTNYRLPKAIFKCH